MLTRRERLLLALLPPVAILAVHFVFLAPPVEGRIEAAQKRLVASGAAGVAADAGRSALADVDGLQRELDQRMRERGNAEQRLTSWTNRWAQPEQRARTVSEIARVLGEAGARVLASGVVASSDDAPAIAPALEALARTLVEEHGAEPQLWRVEVACGFQPLLEVLDTLSHAEFFVLPIACRAQARGASGELTVVLWMWI